MEWISVKDRLPEVIEDIVTLKGLAIITQDSW